MKVEIERKPAALLICVVELDQKDDEREPSLGLETIFLVHSTSKASG